MNRHIMLLLIFMLPLFTGCFNQKATGTQQRWVEIQTATNNWKESLYLSQYAQPEVLLNKGENVQSNYLSSARAIIDASQKFREALEVQKVINVDQRLNAIAEKLQESSELLLVQLKLGLEKMSIAQQLSEEYLRCQDSKTKEKIKLMLDNALKDAESIQLEGVTVLQQIGSHYQELETLRPILNKEYGFNLPQIKWIGQ